MIELVASNMPIQQGAAHQRLLQSVLVAVPINVENVKGCGSLHDILRKGAHRPGQGMAPGQVVAPPVPRIGSTLAGPSR